MGAPSFLELRADAERGIQRGKWALEDEAERASADLAQVALSHGEQVGSLKSDFPFHRGALAAEQAEDREGKRAFARAALADQAENFTLLDFE